MSEDPGVLGNLPRSRPGRRSEKRAGGTTAKRQTAAARKPRTAKPRKAATGQTRARSQARERSAQRRAERADQQQAGGDPVSGAIRAVGGLAEAGVKTGVKVAAGVIKRLPRL